MKIIKAVLKELKELDEKVKKVMTSGFKFSLILGLISALVLVVYESIYSAPNLFYTGLSLFRASAMFAACFLAFGVAFNTIKKQIPS